MTDDLTTHPRHQWKLWDAVPWSVLYASSVSYTCYTFQPEWLLGLWTWSQS